MFKSPQTLWGCLLTLAVTALVAGCNSGTVAAPQAVNRVGVAEFARLVEQGEFVLLDVRTPEEFESGHIPGARNLDIHSPSFSSEIGELDASQGFLVYCRSGRRSARACSLMVDAGFNQLVDLAPGFNGWKSAGQAVAP